MQPREIIAMKKIVILILFINSIVINAQEAATIKGAQINFVFIDNDVDGTFSGFNSSSKIDATDFEKSLFAGSVAVETISTGNSLRNWSLRRSKYFDADSYPKITFSSTNVTGSIDAFTVTGNLTIKNTTKKITLNFTKKDAKLIGETSINSADYGIVIKKNKDQNKVNIQISLLLE